MNITEIIILILLALAIITAASTMYKRKKQGKTCACGTPCAACADAQKCSQAPKNQPTD